jgi:nanoRNase/pAp phosphatase (c-di-AMP/oligoRNAs hydrolase)
MNDSLAELLALDLTGPLLILTHDNPDPDSLSSASALQYLLRATRGADAHVGYSGVVGRAENRAMIELLGLDFRRVSASDLQNYAHLALIDAQPYTGNSIVPSERVVDIVIDHHPLRSSTRGARFYCVRPDIGASATLLTGFLREAGLSIEQNLATALLYGIRTETHDLGRETSDADRDAYHYLFPLADASLLAAIGKPRLSRRYYQHVAHALERARTDGDVLLCQLDEVIDPDFVPEMADYFVRMEAVSWVLVYGYIESRLYLSIRTTDETAHAGEVMRELLHGLGLGGGHGARAGGAVDVVELGMAREVLHATIEERFLKARGASAEQLHPVIDSSSERSKKEEGHDVHC